MWKLPKMPTWIGQVIKVIMVIVIIVIVIWVALWAYRYYLWWAITNAWNAAPGNVTKGTVAGTIATLTKSQSYGAQEIHITNGFMIMDIIKDIPQLQEVLTH